ncbi:unnamed protein product [Calypogeia fissa]
MTVTESNEEAAETAPTSDSDEKRDSDSKKSYGIEEEESNLGDFEVDIILDEEIFENDEQSLRDDKDGAIEQHGETDPHGEGKGKEEEEDCPFCLYMKAGACEKGFANWEACINEGEKSGEDVVEKCVRVTRLLTECMRAHADYYGPVLQAEKAMAASVAGGDGLDNASAEAERTYREAVEVGAQNAVEEAEG